MGLIRVELMTPSLSEKCSNRLSYSPKINYINKREKKRKCSKVKIFLWLYTNHFTFLLERR